LVSALDDILTDYNVQDKVIRTTIDSISNFLKAFTVFGAAPEADDAVSTETSSTAATAQVNYVEVEDEDDDDASVEYQDVSQLIDGHSPSQSEEALCQLLRHQKCACHLLNLVATVDTRKADRNGPCKQLSRSAFAKCQTLWNKTGRCWTAAETFDELCDLQFVRPNQTRWNSTFMVVAQIVRILKEKGELSLRNVCISFKLKP
jgi:hypothetical protein